MKGYISSFINSFILIFIGVVMLASPQLIEYINYNKFFFDFVTFIKDYPRFSCIFGFATIFIGLTGVVLEIIKIVTEKQVYIIQKGLDEDFGLIDLNFKKNMFFNINPIVYTNICSIENADDNLLAIEKKNIYNFYKLNAGKKISFLSISLSPFIVFAGYCIGEVGKRIKHYHYDRNKKNIRMIRRGFVATNELIKDEEIGGG